MKNEQRGGTRHYWLPQDDQALREGFDSLSLAELCRKLGREPQAIGLRCRKLGITARETIKPAALMRAWQGVVQ